MSPKSHLQILNADRATHNNESTFTLFPLLPTELRLKIWRHSLQRRRIIKVFLRAERLFHPEQTTTQETESTTPGSKIERYRAYVNGWQTLSKLMRVNCEAREAALEFYRVHLPCWLRYGETASEFPLERNGILCFNPEYDFLHITWEMWAEDTLLDFLYHLKTTYDPHHVGLLNLAVDDTGLPGDLLELQPSNLDPGVRTAFVETLTQLREVFFVSQQVVGRQYDKRIFWPTQPTEPFFNRSLPLRGLAPTFERLHRDPRPIAQDLGRMFIESDPRRIIHLWKQLLHNFGVLPSQIEYRFCMGISQIGQGIYDHRSAERWLQKEDDQWTAAHPDPDPDQVVENKKNFLSWAFDRLWKEKKTENKTGDLAEVVQPAIGFWLFPVEMLDAVDSKQGIHDLVDVSTQWPELALSSLP
jgi:hypothetical protein